MRNRPPQIEIYHPDRPEQIGRCQPEALQVWLDQGWLQAESDKPEAAPAEPRFVELHGHLVPERSEWTASATSEQEVEVASADNDADESEL